MSDVKDTLASAKRAKELRTTQRLLERAERNCRDNELTRKRKKRAQKRSARIPQDTGNWLTSIQDEAGNDWLIHL